MRHVAAILLFVLAIASGARAQSASSALPSFASPSARHTSARLILSATSAKPGDTIWAGLDMKMEPGWHTYWQNPGAAGLPTTIHWQLPAGISAGPIEWPLPEKFPPLDVVAYGYTNEVVLLVALKIQTNAALGPIDLKARVSWLECKDVCIPASQSVAAALNVGRNTIGSPDAGTIESWRQRVPPPNGNVSIHAWWGGPANGGTRPLIIQGAPLVETKPWYLAPGDFYPAAADDYEIEGATEQLGDPFNPTAFRIRKTVKKFSGNWPAELRGVIVIQNGRQGFQVKFPVAGQPPANASASMAAARAPLSSSAPSGGRGLALELVAAFIGGLILNVMPCVLPVIALKVLAFVREAHSEPRRVRYLGVIYVLGVLVSFLALAGVVIGVRAAGHAAGWGMQFASPVFVVCLTLLVTLVALNLFGVFEVVLGGRAADAAGRLASRHGAPGAFFNGVLATALATSCTSPFLAGAVGFALPQPGAAIVIVFFLAIGLGLATPYVVLIWNPALLKFLPKPGPWMEKFKIAMGFPMLATALWLLNLVYDDYGRNVFWLGLFLVVLALSAWIFGEFVQRGRKHRAIAFVIALLFLGFGYVYALEKGLRWRQPIVPGTPATAETEGGIVWQPWSRAAVTEARAAGHPVLVDFTADWCLTCQINKRIAIETPAVEQELKTLHAVIFTADYTHYSDSITRELNRYHRAGVPLVLVYPKDPSAPAIVLPSILTPGIVLNALQTATKGAPKN